MIDIPRMAISIQQPWAFLIVSGRKHIENRTWKVSNPGLRFRGPVAIHAGKSFDRYAKEDMEFGVHPVTGARFAETSNLQTLGPSHDYFARMLAGELNGGIVGVAEVVDVVTESDSEWFVGKYGLVIANAQPVPFIPCSGALGFFDWRETDRKARERRAAKETATA